MSRTNFRPETDGFLFVNNWNLDQGELGSVRAAFDAAAVAAVALILVWFSVIGGIIIGLGLGVVVAVWIANGSPLQYGLCGGMTFAALDYFRMGWVAPQGSGFGDQPTSPGPGAPLRAYLWQRLLDSLGGNASTFIGWMLVNNFVPTIAPFGVVIVQGGSGWLRSQTKGEWAKLKAHIDNDGPWPLALVASGIDPFACHQVLAYGYNDPGNGTGSLFIYDCNHPGGETTINFDLTGNALSTDYTDFTVLGFFCENYSPSIPPVAVGLTQGLSVAPAGSVNQGATVNLSMTAKNYGYRASPALMLSISGQPSVNEPGQNPIASGGTRQLQGADQLNTPGLDHFLAMCFLGTFAGINIWKSLPAVDPGTTNVASIQVLKPGKEKEQSKDNKDSKDHKDAKEHTKEGKDQMLEKAGLSKEGGHETPLSRFEGAPAQPSLDARLANLENMVQRLSQIQSIQQRVQPGVGTPVPRTKSSSKEVKETKEVKEAKEQKEMKDFEKPPQ